MQGHVHKNKESEAGSPLALVRFKIPPEWWATGPLRTEAQGNNMSIPGGSDTPEKYKPIMDKMDSEYNDFYLSQPEVEYTTIEMLVFIERDDLGIEAEVTALFHYNALSR